MDKVGKILAQWNKERPDIDVIPMGVVGRMKRLSAHLAQGMERVFADHGLNSANFDVLATLRRAGPPFTLSPSELMEWTMVTSGTMTNRLDRLEDAQLVTRMRNPDDGRGYLVALTEKGRALVDVVVSEHVANQSAMISVLTDADRATLDHLLRKWLCVFERIEPDGPDQS